MILGDKKMGRPTDCPKSYRVTARVDEETKKILDQYCEKYAGAVYGIEVICKSQKRFSGSSYKSQEKE